MPCGASERSIDRLQERVSVREARQTVMAGPVAEGFLEPASIGHVATVQDDRRGRIFGIGRARDGLEDAPIRAELRLRRARREPPFHRAACQPVRPRLEQVEELLVVPRVDEAGRGASDERGRLDAEEQLRGRARVGDCPVPIDHRDQVGGVLDESTEARLALAEAVLLAHQERVSPPGPLPASEEEAREDRRREQRCHRADVGCGGAGGRGRLEAGLCRLADPPKRIARGIDDLDLQDRRARKVFGPEGRQLLVECASIRLEGRAECGEPEARPFVEGERHEDLVGARPGSLEVRRLGLG